MLRLKHILMCSSILFLGASPCFADSKFLELASSNQSSVVTTNSIDRHTVANKASSATSATPTGSYAYEAVLNDSNTKTLDQTKSSDSSGLTKILAIFSILISLSLIGFLFGMILPLIKKLELRINENSNKPKTLKSMNNSNKPEHNRDLIEIRSELDYVKNSVLKISEEIEKINGIVEKRKTFKKEKEPISKQQNQFTQINPDTTNNSNPSLSIDKVNVISKEDINLLENTSSNVKEVFYYKEVNDNHNFDISDNNVALENTSVFEVLHLRNNEWIFKVIEKTQMLPIIIRNLDDILGPVCDFENYASSNAKMIENVTPGRLQLIGNELVVTKKALIKLI